MQQACRAVAMHVAERIAALGPLEVIAGGQDGIPVVCWKLREGPDHGFTLFDVAERLQARGWQVPAYTLPADCEKIAVQRIVVRHGVSHTLADLLLGDLRHARADLQGGRFRPVPSRPPRRRDLHIREVVGGRW